MLLVFTWWQFQTNSRESYISYACGSSKVICNIQTYIAIEAPEASGYSRRPVERFAQNLLGTKRSSWWLCIANGCVNASQSASVWKLATCDTERHRFALECRLKTNRQSRGLRLGSERDNNARHRQKDKAVHFNSSRSSR